MLAWEDTPLVAIMAPLEINPQIIMWDPDTYPDIQTIADLGEAGVTINIFRLTASPTCSSPRASGRLIRSTRRTTARRRGSSSRSTSPSRASPRPSRTPTSSRSRSTARRPAYQLLHDAGYPTYSQTLSVLPEDVEGMAACWEKFIPIAQQAQVDFVNDPARANAIIVDAVEQVDSFWVYTPGLAEYSVQTQLELGLVGNGPDDTLGNFDEARVQEMLDLIRQTPAPRSPTTSPQPRCSPTSSSTPASASDPTRSCRAQYRGRGTERDMDALRSVLVGFAAREPHGAAAVELGRLDERHLDQPGQLVVELLRRRGGRSPRPSARGPTRAAGRPFQAPTSSCVR